MQLLPIQTAKFAPGDALIDELLKTKFQDDDVIVISSKVIAISENFVTDLSKMKVSDAAKEWSAQCGRTPEFCEAVKRETERLHGEVVGHCPGAMLTEVRPEGLRIGSILTANAGLDESNVPTGTTIGWPEDPISSVKKIRAAIEQKQNVKVAVMISDSCCRPRRWGVTAFALTVSGLDPLSPQAGRKDLFGKELRITTEAVADQLATAANFLMGNANQATPAVIIRDHGIELSDFTGWVDGIEPADDLFAGIL